MQLNFEPCDSLFASIEEQLRSYANNGLLDLSQFYPQIRWFISHLGLAAYEKEQGILMVEDHKAQLPCDFYMLDSAWLCDQSHTSITDNWQGKYVYYTTTTCETLEQQQSCPPPNALGLTVNTCQGDGKLIDKITVTEYVSGAGTPITFNNPIMLRLIPNKSIQNVCNKKCANLFASSPYEISISKKGDAYILSSNIKEAVIFLEYWRYPMDENNLPMIPDDPIIQEALRSHLIHYFLVSVWTDGADANIENKIRYWGEKASMNLTTAKVYAKMPSFAQAVNSARVTRRRWSTYEIQNYHG